MSRWFGRGLRRFLRNQLQRRARHVSTSVHSSERARGRPKSYQNLQALAAKRIARSARPALPCAFTGGERFASLRARLSAQDPSGDETSPRWARELCGLNLSRWFGRGLRRFVRNQFQRRARHVSTSVHSSKRARDRPKIYQNLQALAAKRIARSARRALPCAFSGSQPFAVLRARLSAQDPSGDETSPR